MSIKSNAVEEALRLADEPAQPKQAPQTPNAELVRQLADALDRVMAEPREVSRPLACAAAPPPLQPAQPKQAPQTPNADRARKIADARDRVMAEPREVSRPLACAAAPPLLHDEAVPMREYDEDDYNIRRYKPDLRRVIILVAVIIAVPVMMWPITNIFRSYVERPTPTVPAFDPDRGQSSSEAPQTAQSAPAPLLTDAARTAAGDGLASLPDPNSGSPKGPLALPPGDALPPAATPTGPAETAPNAPAAAPGEAAAVTDNARSAATAETAPSEAVSPEAIRGSIPLQRDRLTATGPATGSMAWVGPIPLPRVRPVDAPVDTPPVPSSPQSDSPLLAHPAPYGGPGADSAH